jgi:putative redox protein
VARIVAIQKRIKLNGMDIKVEGDVDLETLLGKSKENRAGFTGIKIILNIDAEMTKEEKHAFIHEVESRCPVSDNVANITPLTIEII